MKAILVLLALAFVCARAIPGAYSDVDPAEVEDSPTLKGLLEFGQREFIQQALECNKISDPSLTLSKIDSISQQVVAGLNVKFNVEFTNSNGQVIFVTMVVFYQPWTGIKELTSYSVNDSPQF